MTSRNLNYQCICSNSYSLKIQGCRLIWSQTADTLHCVVTKLIMRVAKRHLLLGRSWPYKVLDGNSMSYHLAKTLLTRMKLGPLINPFYSQNLLHNTKYQSLYKTLYWKKNTVKYSKLHIKCQLIHTLKTCVCNFWLN